MSQEGARHRAGLWLRQGGGQAAQACFQAQQVGEKAIKALLAAEDRDLRSATQLGKGGTGGER